MMILVSIRYLRKESYYYSFRKNLSENMFGPKPYMAVNYCLKNYVKYNVLLCSF